MDVLTSAADAVFSHGGQEGEQCHHTPNKRSHGVLSEVTHTVNISPTKLHNSSLQSLFTAPLHSPSIKRQGSKATLVLTPRSRGVGRRGGSSKSISYPSPMLEAPGSSREVRQGRSPLTPTSNLKLLTHIASMEESFTSKKVLFQSKRINCEKDENSPVTDSHARKPRPRQKSKFRRCNSDIFGPKHASHKVTASTKTVLKKHPSSCDHMRSTSPNSLMTVGMGHLAPLEETPIRSSEGSRKDKSLGLLSEKFLEHFPMEVSFLETPRRLVIDEVAAVLGTERRRVYDIINVLESLNMAARVQKNMYQWMGKLHLEETLGRLKALALKLNLEAQVKALHLVGCDGEFKFPQKIKAVLNSDGDRLDTRREKSLGILCQKFLMLLLSSPEPYLLSLDHTLKILMGEMGDDSDRLRTRGRRLYDIANVLTSLGLVQRVPLAKGFRYIGPQVEPIPIDEVPDPAAVHHRHSLLPSRLCLWVGDSGGKESLSCPGDHDVTPSSVAPPVQKRGRPRKLSTDFSASTIPAAKRTRIQRTRSEDITIGKQSRKIARHPSLHDICQVAEVEREKLLQKEQHHHQQQRQQQQYHQVQQQQQQEQQQQQQQHYQHQQQQQSYTTRKPSCLGVMPVTMPGFLSANSVVGPSLTTLLHQKHFAMRTKIPVALTFKKSDESNTKDSFTFIPTNIVQKVPTKSGFITENSCTQVQTTSHSSQGEHGKKQSFFTSGVSKTAQYVSDSSHPVNKILLTSWSSETSGVPMVTAKAPHSTTHSVIKVVTNMGAGASYHREPPKVFTVLPTSQTYTPAAKQFVVQAGGGLQQASPKHGGCPQIFEGTSSFTEYGQNKTSPFTVYTVSGSQVALSSSVTSHSALSPVSGTQSSLSTEKSSVPKSVAHSWSDNLYVSGPSVSVSGVPGHQITNGFIPLPPSSVPSSCEQTRVEWQSSPDRSGTDSELEEIFGDSFRFTRPKSLVNGNASQDGDHSSML